MGGASGRSGNFAHSVVQKSSGATKVHSKAKGPTKAERDRTAWIKEDGCIACRKKGYHRLADADHLLCGGVRRGHAEQIPLCEYHHRGMSLNFTQQQARDTLGPSRQHEPASFMTEFGTDEELLTETDKRYGNRVKPAGY